MGAYAMTAVNSIEKKCTQKHKNFPPELGLMHNQNSNPESKRSLWPFGPEKANSPKD